MNYEHSFLLYRFRIIKTQELVEEFLYLQFILEIKLIKKIVIKYHLCCYKSTLFKHTISCNSTA